MIKQLLEFKSSNEIPSDEDILQCLDIQKNNPDKIVILHWYVKWSGNYKLSFENINNLDEAWENMPKCYGL